MKTNGSEEGEQDNQYVFTMDILEMPGHLDKNVTAISLRR
jgi:hypothetical protein